jgi:hypothetical protein
MFVPVPPADEAKPKTMELESEPVDSVADRRFRGRWHTLRQLCSLCRILAVASLVGSVLVAFFAFGMLRYMEIDRLISYAGTVVLAIFSCVFWVLVAEGILLAIAIERNTRQTRDRLLRMHSEAQETEERAHQRDGASKD